MTAKHSPGPWTWRPSGRLSLVDRNGNEVAAFASVRIADKDTLSSAADLLEMVRSLAAHCAVLEKLTSLTDSVTLESAWALLRRVDGQENET